MTRDDHSGIPGTTRGPLWRWLLLAVVALAITWVYLPDIKQVWWDSLRTHTGGERHGDTVFRTVPLDTPYDRWLDGARARLPVFEGLVIPDISTVQLGPWPELGPGIRGLYLRFADYQISDGRILELPPGTGAEPQRHLFEMGVYFLGGPGHTLFFTGTGQSQRVDWQAGSLLSVPLNTRYQHFNDSGSPVRILAITSFPFALNAAGSEAFLLDNDHDFADRYAAEPDYFRRSERVDDRRRRQNLVPDVKTVELEGGGKRGPGSRTMSWPMAGNTVLDLHVSAMLPRHHQRAHRHSSDAFLLILSGEGYSLIWKGDDVSRRQRIDWRKHTLLVPPTYWYHQHFNPGPVESRHLAINAPTLVRNLGLRFYDQLERDSAAVQAEWATELRRRTRAAVPGTR